MLDPSVGESVRRQFEALEPVLGERSRRQWAAAEALALGWGGVSVVAAATGLSRTTVNVGVRELRARAGSDAAGPAGPRLRSAGGGRWPLAEADPAIVAALDELVGPSTRGDPASPLRWTLKSTAKLAAELMGRPRYPAATELTVTADGGGSDSSRGRLWNVALQGLADATGLTLHVSHFPPGTSKWNKIEHRLFCHVTQNWRGRPLVSHDVIVDLIGATTTKGGLKVNAALTPGSHVHIPAHRRHRVEGTDSTQATVWLAV